MIAALLLGLCALVSFYIVVGYPLLLRRWRRFGPTVCKDLQFQPTVTVLLAVYNGQQFILQKLDNLLSLDYPKGLMDIVVVSDGSTDSTDSLVSSCADPRVRLVCVPHGGKAAALNAALSHATGNILFFVDARQRIDEHALRHLVANFADPSVGAVTGELRYTHGRRVGEAADIDLYWRYEIWARQQHSKIDSIFNTTGCIYAMRRTLASQIASDTLIDDAAIPQQAFFQGYRVVIDTNAVAYDYGEVHGGEFRRKLRQLAGAWQVWARRPPLFTSANRMRFHFLSHKFSRLMLPWIILTGIAAALWLPRGALRTALLGIGFAFALLAVLDPLLPKDFPLRQISSPVRSFVVLNFAALLSVMVFVVSPDRLWKPTRLPQETAETLLSNQSENKF